MGPCCGSLGTLGVSGAQTAHAAALWSCALLLGLLRLCACVEENCIVGIVGQPVSLPCVQPQMTTSANVSVEWWRGEEVVLRSTWRGDGVVEEWSINRASTPPDGPLSGDVSLQLPAVVLTERAERYRLLATSENRSAELCSVCLRTAARFSAPLLRREEPPPGGQTAFWCQSGGGFPEPAVSWLLDGGEDPPEGSVWTRAAVLPDSLLYNVTSRLTLNVSAGASVSCVVRNPTTNETLTSTNGLAEVTRGPVVTSRASEAMWIFSTVLCAVVGVMVSVGIVYQIHLDRVSKRKKREFQKHLNTGGNKGRPEEEEVKLERKETDV
ncbi:ICOS ligand-like [Pseudoliparis swirei]|uniref:ICOS ligand-like n=1 Tax=Pseudoliparis swirei TaxID=2059687 RepID=UPI0024BD6986|nr:ICOS ligand-like [Pseudoliparis swirei]